MGPHSLRRPRAGFDSCGRSRLRACEQGFGPREDRLAIRVGCLCEACLHELLAALEDLRPGLRVLTPTLEELLEPAAAVFRVQGLVRPVELHVVCRGRVAHRLE